ncbi:MAG: aldo/keto reductase [Alphaproteobacteria bacterium]|nr:aldo/keto reductase [Alphaproteobacteria bacterium]
MADISNAKKRRLGASDLECVSLGLGCMSLSGAYGAADDEENVKFVRHAIDQGADFLDSSDMYGWGHNEELLARALADGYRDKVVLATKFGQTQLEGGGMGVNGRPEYVAEACDKSLQRLGIDVIDLYYQHRVDQEVPIEETVGAMSKLVEAGKVKAIGICEAKPATIRRAHVTYPLAAVQSEFSILYREEAEQIRAVTSELGISFVAYSPLGRGLLTDNFINAETVPEDDPHYRHPRFAQGNFQQNRELALRVAEFAAEKNCSPAQVVLAWLLGQGDDVVAIPGTKRTERFDENMGALNVSLSADELAAMSSAVPVGAAAGTRYPEPQMKKVFVDSTVG